MNRTKLPPLKAWLIFLGAATVTKSARLLHWEVFLSDYIPHTELSTF